MSVWLTHEAEDDLERISDYIARDNPKLALTFLRELHEKCLGLANMPLAFSLLPRYEVRGVRRRVHGAGWGFCCPERQC